MLPLNPSACRIGSYPKRLFFIVMRGGVRDGEQKCHPMPSNGRRQRVFGHTSSAI
jgi:hypothetical protein